jgi:CRP-like cAMP-binding protein
MQPELELKAISHTVIAISISTLLFVPVISLRKRLRGSTPLHGIVR